MNQYLFYAGASLPLVWGIAHLFPTASVVRGFGDISSDNKQIILMEWIVEGVFLIFIGLVVSTVTFLDYRSALSTAIYWLSFGILNVLSVISYFTGFKVSFVPFKLCPVIFTGASVLILSGLCL